MQEAVDRVDPRRRRRAVLLLAAVGLHLLASTFLAFDGVDRLAGTLPPAPDPTLYPGTRDRVLDPEAYLLVCVPGLPAFLALPLVLVLPGRGPRWAGLLLGVLGVVVALLLTPLYGLGLLLVPGAALALLAGRLADRPPPPGPQPDRRTGISR